MHARIDRDGTDTANRGCSDRGVDRIQTELSGLDALDLAAPPTPGRFETLWRGAWPKLAAILLAVILWQAVVLTGWRPRYVLPGPFEVFGTLFEDLTSGDLTRAILVTMRRALIGYGAALLIGTTLGLVVSRVRTLRSALGSMITGLQTMPSIAWFPLAILLFGLTESAIFFVVAVGAAPAIANGLISGIDNIPPLYLRAGRVMGAQGLAEYRHVVLPAAMPGYVAGLKQGWAFSWRSLMAGELIVIIANRPSLGVQLQISREFSDASGLLATMVVILAIGIVVDEVFFGRLERRMRSRRGLVYAGS